MKIGTQEVQAGGTYACDRCSFTLPLPGLPALLVAVDHFGAHLTGNAAVLAATTTVRIAK